MHEDLLGLVPWPGKAVKIGTDVPPPPCDFT